ncbi:MAG: Mg-chelatase subunit ChlD, partial [Kiritimatiellia bacterium]
MSRLLPVLSAVALLGLSGCLKSVETEHELPTATADTSSTSSVVLFDVEETESSTKDERAQNSESGAGQNVQNEPTEVHDLKQSTEAQTPQPDVGGYVDQHEFADQEDFDGDMGLDSLDPIRPSPELHTGRDKAIQISGGVSTSRNSRHRHQAHKKPKAKQKSDASAVSAPPSLPVGGLFVPADPPPPPIVREAVTENYTDYGVNGFELSERDNLSTFAVDVDTASYTITRRKLTEGYLPPTSAVRVEEFVNYFPYEYTQPKPGDPFAVDMEASPSPYNPTNHIVRVGVQGKKVSFDSRKAVHLTFLVDVSGSMQSRDKMGMVKDSLKMLTQELEDGDTVAIATYAGATKIVLNPTPMSRKADIIRALDGLTAGGSTAMGAGIDLAYGLADASYRDGSVNRVIVCSDGDANVGQISHAQLSNKIKGYANKGITLTTIGFGNGNYNDTMMERLANDGDGNYFYIDSLKESRRIFIDKLSSTLEVIAKDVKIQVEWNNEA